LKLATESVPVVPSSPVDPCSVRGRAVKDAVLVPPLPTNIPDLKRRTTATVINKTLFEIMSMFNFKEGLIEKSKLAQHAYEEDRKVMCDEARVLEVESNSRYRKYKESAHVACSTNPISQPSLDISPTSIPLISDEVTKSKRKP
jgi:hypothetical protein